jgi:hypothetical protein
MQRRLESFAIDRLRARHPRATRIFIDLDPAVDPTHGQQPLAFFNGHYDTWCYLPMFGFLSVEGGTDQYLFHARLRSGLSKESKGTPQLLCRTIEQLRKRWKNAKICVRLDAGFAHPRVLEVLDELGVEYVVAMGRNSRLAELGERAMHAAELLAKRFESTMTLFCRGWYQAKSWLERRRVVVKAEVVHAPGKAPRRNDRYVITNLTDDPEDVWKLYCQRGDSENRIKELKCELSIDRTSCTDFLANQMRVTMTALAYMLFQELRSTLTGTDSRRATVGTLRLRLVKVGATIVESVRRWRISMSRGHPWRELWLRAAGAVARMA